MHVRREESDMNKHNQAHCSNMREDYRQRPESKSTALTSTLAGARYTGEIPQLDPSYTTYSFENKLLHRKSISGGPKSNY